MERMELPLKTLGAVPALEEEELLSVTTEELEMNGDLIELEKPDEDGSEDAFMPEPELVNNDESEDDNDTEAELTAEEDCDPLLDGEATPLAGATVKDGLGMPTEFEDDPESTMLTKEDDDAASIEADAESKGDENKEEPD